MSGRTILILVVVGIIVITVALVIGLVALFLPVSRSVEVAPDVTTVTTAPPSQGMPAPGDPLSVETALTEAAGNPGPFLVTGYLFVYADGSARLSDMILESYPPQPGGATIKVEGLEASEFDLTTSGQVSWSDTPVSLLGTIDPIMTTLTVSTDSI